MDASIAIMAQHFKAKNNENFAMNTVNYGSVQVYLQSCKVVTRKNTLASN